MRGAIIGAVIGIASLISLYLPYYTSHITLGYFFKYHEIIWTFIVGLVFL